jgi:hypothetical protein
MVYALRTCLRLYARGVVSRVFFASSDASVVSEKVWAKWRWDEEEKEESACGFSKQVEENQS